MSDKTIGILIGLGALLIGWAAYKSLKRSDARLLAMQGYY